MATTIKELNYRLEVQEEKIKMMAETLAMFRQHFELLNATIIRGGANATVATPVGEGATAVTPPSIRRAIA